ncbi:alpha/beta hydrolase [Microbacterium sp. NPDC091313]
MALMNLAFRSEYLRGGQTISVILPDRPESTAPADFFTSGRRYRVLWLLHGTFGDHTDWVRHTNIERYAAAHDLVVVMPAALNSNYSDWPSFSLGFDAYRYLTHELMPMVQGWLPVSAARSDNFVAGLSMGGRGAIKYAVNHPELFGAAAILSAAPVEFDAMRPEDLADPDRPFGARLLGMAENAGGWSRFIDSEENVWRLIDAQAGQGVLPRLLFACGEDDQLIHEDYVAFRAHAERSGLEAEFWEAPGGHDWPFWDAAIHHAIDFFMATPGDRDGA